MYPISFLNVAAAQISQHPVSVLRMRGNFNGITAQRYLMLFDNAFPASNGVAPLISSIPLYQSTAGNPTPFFAEFEIGALEAVNGLYAAVSTTQETFTLSTDKMDITVELSDPEFPVGTTFVSANNVATLQVYADDASGPNRQLYSIAVTNTYGATLYLMLFTYAGPASGASPHMQWTVLNGQTLNLKFGRDGMHPIDGAVGVQTQGCTLFASVSSPFLAEPINGLNLVAEYK